jgi:hypothetical protein
MVRERDMSSYLLYFKSFFQKNYFDREVIIRTNTSGSILIYIHEHPVSNWPNSTHSASLKCFEDLFPFVKVTWNF